MEIRKINAYELPELLDVVKSALGEREDKKRSEAWWRWKHIDNPFGESLVLGAYDGKHLVAVRAFMKWNLEKGSDIVPAVRAVDTATHPEYQRQGLFKKLTLSALDIAREEGAVFVFNTPNDNSWPGYKKMGWEKVGSINYALKPIRPLRMIYRLAHKNNRLPAIDVWPGVSVEKFIEGIDFSCLRKTVLNTCHDWHTLFIENYLRWRYTEHPFFSYRVIYNGDISDPEGVLIYRLRHRKGIIEASVTEYWYKQNNNPTKMLSKLLSPLKQFAEIDYILIYSQISAMDEKISFFDHKGFIRHSSISQRLTIRSLNDDCSKMGFNSQDWSLSLGDFELF